ncbi:MAG: SprT family zinc-dependent metalloprotease [Rikenellaceae bacterium]
MAVTNINSGGRTIKDCIYKVGDIVINYEVHYSIRKTISMQVRGKDMMVIVKLPIGYSPSYAEKFVSEKVNWIQKSIDKLSSAQEKIPVRSYIDGSSHLLLGKTYTLKFVKGSQSRVECDDNFIYVTTVAPEYMEPILRVWYENKANELITPIFTDITFAFSERHNVMPKSLEYKYVKSFWGLCTSKGAIRLNIDLVRAPLECIEYIIMHELCHLLHHDHSPRFYNTLTMEMPDWERRKKLLNDTISTRR